MKNDRGAAEYRLLATALDDVAPPCSNDDRFILDAHEYNAQELDHLRFTVCRGCPVEQLCRAYGQAAKPSAGVWGGRVYTTRQNAKG